MPIDFLRQNAWFVLVSALVLVACGGSKDGKAYLNEAERLIKKGDQTGAVIQLKNALEKEPQNKEARLMLGTSYNKKEQYAAAEKELRKARELGMTEDRLLPQLVTAMLGQGESQRLLDEMPEASNATAETRAIVMTGRGNALLGLNKKDEARSAFDEALKLVPDYPEALLGHARIEALAGNLQGALGEVERILAKNPNGKDALLMKGDLLHALGRVNEAGAAYLQATRVAPESISAWLKIVPVYLASGKIADAKVAVERAHKLAPGNLLVRYMEGLVEFRQGHLERARDRLEEVLNAAPDNVPANLLAGTVAYDLGSFQQAQSYLAKVIERAPSNALGRKLLAATALKLGNGPKAEEILKPLAPEKSDDPAVLALMGEIRLRARDFNQAGQYLERASRLSPNPALRTDLAVARLAQGDSERALTDLEAASAASPGFVKADSVLITAYLGKKEYDQALEAIARLEKKMPNSPVTLNLKGIAYLGKNDEVTARACFERALVLRPGYFAAAANLAQLDVKAGKIQAAKRRFDAVLAHDKNSLPAMLALADLALRDRREQDYVSWLERAAKAAPAAPQPRLLLARYHLAKNEPGKALSLAREVSDANPGSAEALDLLGNAQLAAGEQDNALDTFRKLVGVAPNSALAYLRLASAELALEQQEEARSSFKHAVELKPDFLDASAALAVLEISSGRFSEAQKLVANVQQRFPRQAVGFALEGDAWMARKQYAKAASLYEAARQRGPSGLLAIKLDEAYTLAGKPEGSLAPLLQWLNDHPEDARARQYYAGALANRGQRKAAIEQYLLLLGRTADVVALNNVASAMQEENDPRALGYAEQAYKLQPGNPGVLDTLGWILVEQGQARRGIELLRQALSKSPNMAVVHFHLASALAQSGDKERAKAELHRLLEGGARFPQEQEAKSLLQQLQGAAH